MPFLPFLPGKRVWPLGRSRVVTAIYQALYVCTYRCVKKVLPSRGRAVRVAGGAEGNLPKLLENTEVDIYLVPYEMYLYLDMNAFFVDFYWCI